MNLYIAHTTVHTQFFSTEVELSSSYIPSMPLNDAHLEGFFLQGVQMALPFLIVSRIKKVAELIRRIFAMKTSECNVIKPQRSTLKCIDTRQTKRLSSYFHL